MLLSTRPFVWQALAVVIVLLLSVFALCFYFKTLFITMVIGFTLILVTERFLAEYRRSSQRYNLRPWQRRLYGTALVVFWAFILVFLVRNSGAQILGVLRQIGFSDETITSVYGTKIYPYVPVLLRNEAFTVEIVTTVSTYLSSLSRDILSQTVSFVVSGALIIPLMFYAYFWRRHTMAKGIVDMTPERFRDSLRRGARDIVSQLHAFFAARVTQSIAVGAICCLGFFVAGVRGWLILGVLAGFLNIVPYFGPLIGAVPPLIISLLVDESIVALYVLLTVAIAQAVDNFYLQPFFISSVIRVDPLLSILLILAATQLFGILGTVSVLPMYLVGKIVVREVYEELVRVSG